MEGELHCAAQRACALGEQQAGRLVPAPKAMIAYSYDKLPHLRGAVAKPTALARTAAKAMLSGCEAPEQVSD